MTLMEMRNGHIGSPSAPKGPNWPGREGNSYEVRDVHAQPQGYSETAKAVIETTKQVRRGGLDSSEAGVLFGSTIDPL